MLREILELTFLQTPQEILDVAVLQMFWKPRVDLDSAFPHKRFEESVIWHFQILRELLDLALLQGFREILDSVFFKCFRQILNLAFSQMFREFLDLAFLQMFREILGLAFLLNWIQIQVFNCTRACARCCIRVLCTGCNGTSARLGQHSRRCTQQEARSQ